MPLDMTDAVLDDDLMDCFSVIRRPQVITTKGRVTTPNNVTYNPVYGAVNAGSPNDLDRGADEQHFTKSISVVTPFRLRGEANGYQPDIVVWRGDNYLVKSLGDYSRSGWVWAECESIDFLDNPPGRC